MSQKVMHGWQAIAGGRGEAYFTDEETGERELALYLINLSADLEINTTDVDRLGATMKGKKELGSSGSGSVECHANTPIFAKMALRFKQTGVMPRLTIQVTNDDPGAGVGRQTCILKHCLFEKLPLVTIDASEDIIKFSSDFSFEDYEYPELYSKLNA
jgi:hypothetical protein